MAKKSNKYCHHYSTKKRSGLCLRALSTTFQLPYIKSVLLVTNKLYKRPIVTINVFHQKLGQSHVLSTIKVFLMIGQRKGGNAMFTKSKMAPVNISQNDYLALSLCLLCITILRR